MGRCRRYIKKLASLICVRIAGDFRFRPARMTTTKTAIEPKSAQGAAHGSPSNPQDGRASVGTRDRAARNERPMRLSVVDGRGMAARNMPAAKQGKKRIRRMAILP